VLILVISCAQEGHTAHDLAKTEKIKLVLDVYSKFFGCSCPVIPLTSFVFPCSAPS
jgi:hypothetical protein